MSDKPAKNLVKMSKFLSLILRHQPEKIGIMLDEQGWVDVDELIEAASRHRQPLTRELLQSVVEENDKQRFQLSDDGSQIRATQGHSVSVDLGTLPGGESGSLAAISPGRTWARTG